MAVMSIVFGIGGAWFGYLTGIESTIFVLIGIGTYSWAVRISFDALLSGGEDRLLELIDADVKDDEFKALESFYSLVKPISIKLPDEVSAYKVEKLHKKEAQMQKAAELNA